MKLIFSAAVFSLFIACNSFPIDSQNSKDKFRVTNEVQEFKNLMTQDQINKTSVNAEVLTYLLNEPDPQQKNTALIIENRSNCNIIVRAAEKKQNRSTTFRFMQTPKISLSLKKETML